MENDPSPPAAHTEQPTLSETIISPTSRLRALRLRDKQVRSASNTLPDSYTISYYVNQRNEALPADVMEPFRTIEADRSWDGKSMPMVRLGNPIIAVNAQMERAINDAFATIQSQLPGRFTFVPTLSPKEADILFAAVKNVETITASTSRKTGAIVLGQSAFWSPYNADQRQTVLHEIGHALGLEHPQNWQKEDHVPSKEDASLFDTVMTYERNNKLSSHPLITENGAAVSLMPADIQALQTLYPIASDMAQTPPAVGLAAGTTPSPYFSVEVRNAARQAVLFPTTGSVYQPVAATGHDSIHITSLAPSPFKNIRENDTGGQVSSSLSIRQTDAGIAITKPYGEGTTFLPIHAEKIELSTDAEHVRIRGNTTVIVAPNKAPPWHDPQMPMDFISVTGSNNHIQLPASELQESNTLISLVPGAQVSITLQQPNPLPRKLILGNFIQLNYILTEPSGNLTMDWRRDANNDYQLRIHDASDKPPIAISITLEGATPLTHAKFQTMLRQNAFADTVGNTLRVTPHETTTDTSASHGLPTTASIPAEAGIVRKR